MPEGRANDSLRGLLIDYGGVLTTPVADSLVEWAADNGLSAERLGDVLRDWVVGSYAAPDEDNPVHQLERGEISVAAFEREFVNQLRPDGGEPVATGGGLIGRMFDSFAGVPAMFDLVRSARAAGLRTCLLSNSWGDTYQRDGWDQLFDAVVISGEVGMRKPEERIYHYAVDAVGLAPGQCAFIDDIEVNVHVARDLGILGIHHTSPEATTKELETALRMPLR